MKIRSVGHIASVEETRNSFGENTRTKEPLENLDVGGRVILKWILKK
jgi:hypothetical protein